MFKIFQSANNWPLAMPDEAVQKEFHVLLFDEQKSSSIATELDVDVSIIN